MAFGAFIKEARLRKGISLRTLAKITQLDLAYLSRLEREIIKPPTKNESIQVIAEALQLEENEISSLFDLAAVDQKKIPEDINIPSESLEALPFLLRTIDSQRLSKAQITDLTNRIKDLYK